MTRSSNRLASIRRSIQVQGPPERVYAAFKTNDAVSNWYMDGATVDFRVDGQLIFEGPEGEVPATIAELHENERIVLDYHPPWWGTVTYTLKATPTGTRVTLEHEGFQGREDWMERFTWGWEAFLKALKAHVEGRPVK